MLDKIKDNYKYLIGALGYIIVATFVYGMLADSIWHKWFITLIAAVVVAIIGILVAYFYIKFLKKEQNK